MRNHLVGTMTQDEDDAVVTKVLGVELGALGNRGGDAVVGVGEGLLEGDGGLDVGDLLHIVVSFIW